MEGRKYKTKKETLLHSLPTEAGNSFPQVNFYISLNVFGQISGKKKVDWALLLLFSIGSGNSEQQVTEGWYNIPCNILFKYPSLATDNVRKTFDITLYDNSCVLSPYTKSIIYVNETKTLLVK